METVMKVLATLVTFVLFAGLVPAQGKKVGVEETSNLTAEQLRAEYEFLADPESPKLYPMDKALEIAKLQNKPVLCWMGEHAFADENVRRLSMQLKSTTVQASMASDPDNPKYDRFNPRVKFDTTQYLNGGKTYFIRAADFKFESASVPIEQTTAYRIMAMFDSKAQPPGTDPLTGAKTGK